MELLVFMFVLTIPATVVAFVMGRRSKMTNVCHSGQVRYGVTGDGRFAVNVVLLLDGRPYRFAVRVPRKASEKLARAIVDVEEVELDGGIVGDAVADARRN